MTFHHSNQDQPSERTSPTSWEKTLELMEYLNDVVEPSVLVEFAIKHVAPNCQSRHQENIATARAVNVSVNTVENWRVGATKCSMPLRLATAVGKLFPGPRSVLHALGQFTGSDHTVAFDWAQITTSDESAR